MISKRNTFIVTLYVLYVISIIYVNFYIYGVLQIKSDIPHLETGGYAIFGYILFIISIICSCFWDCKKFSTTEKVFVPGPRKR